MGSLVIKCIMVILMFLLHSTFVHARRISTSFLLKVLSSCE